MGKKIRDTPLFVSYSRRNTGHAPLTLSNWLTSGVPQIIGTIECAGALYSFATLTTIEGLTDVAAGKVYVYVEPSIDGTARAVWRETPPEWSDIKQGWYAPDDGRYRCAFACRKVDATTINDKQALPERITVANARAVLDLLQKYNHGDFCIGTRQGTDYPDKEMGVLTPSYGTSFNETFPVADGEVWLVLDNVFTGRVGLVDKIYLAKEDVHGVAGGTLGTYEISMARLI